MYSTAYQRQLVQEGYGNHPEDFSLSLDDAIALMEKIHVEVDQNLDEAESSWNPFRRHKIKMRNRHLLARCRRLIDYHKQRK